MAAATAGSGSLPGAAGGAVASTPRAVEIAGRHMQAGEAADRLRLGLVLGQHAGVKLGGVRPRRPSAAGLGFRDQRVAAAGQRPDEALDEAAHLAFRQRADEAIDRLAAVEGDHRRNRLDAELAGNLGMVVDVHLDQRHLALGVGDRFLQHRRELLARPAPGRPEIHQHRLASEAVNTSALKLAVVTSLTEPAV